MGKTKTAFVGEVAETLTGAEKYKQKQIKKQEQLAGVPQKPVDVEIPVVASDGPKTEKPKAQPKHEKASVKGVGLKGGERIKVIGSDDEPLPETITKETPKDKEKVTVLKIRGNNYKTAKAKTDRLKLYPLADAISLLRKISFAKFDSTVEMHLIVKKKGLSAKVSLPHFAGKSKKIEIADDALIEKLKKGVIDFDVLLATADFMPKLVPFAKLLGPKGLMPNPKTGTLIKDKKSATNFSAESLNLKTEKDAPVMHTVVGKLSQKDSDLEENAKAIINAISSKMIEKAYLKSTMSPSIKLSI